ncbi:hypothetical protein GCM10020000_42060 [Streptomyces olivoverticillatus]
MSQLGRKPGPVLPGPASAPSVSGYVRRRGWIQDGTRTGLARPRSRAARTGSRAAGPARRAGPPGQGGIPGGGYGGHGGGYGGGPQQWQQPAAYDEPEYFGGGQQQPYGGHPGAPGPYQAPPAADPGHTRQFSLGEAPDAYAPYGDDQGYGDGSTYQAGAPAPPSGPPGCTGRTC